MKGEFPLVVVTWRDAQTHESWETPEPLDGLPNVESVGFLYEDTPSHISLLPNYDFTNNNGSCRMDIPRGCVVEIHELGVVRKIG
jgi:hypothetical protein